MDSFLARLIGKNGSTKRAHDSWGGINREELISQYIFFDRFTEEQIEAAVAFALDFIEIMEGTKIIPEISAENGDKLSYEDYKGQSQRERDIDLFRRLYVSHPEMFELVILHFWILGCSSILIEVDNEADNQSYLSKISGIDDLFSKIQPDKQKRKDALQNLCIYYREKLNPSSDQEEIEKYQRITISLLCLYINNQEDKNF